MYFDIHSHILPGVDDGSADMTESIAILKLMQSQGITDVIATPHFYPQEDNLTDFSQMVTKTFEELSKRAERNKLPKIYLGCEMLYFKGIGSSTSLAELCLNGSDFLLLELTEEAICDALFDDILTMRNNLGITPIIAHIERYCKAKNYRKLIEFVIAEHIPVQVNASSFTIPILNRAVAKLIKNDVSFVIGTDTHSVDFRPPMLSQALDIIEKKYGTDLKKQIIDNSRILFEKIVCRAE